MDRIRNASSQQELMDSFKEFGRSVVELSERAAQRQAVSRNLKRIFIIVVAFAIFCHHCCHFCIFSSLLLSLKFLYSLTMIAKDLIKQQNRITSVV